MSSNSGFLTLTSLTLPLSLLATTALADVVHNDDVIVDGSLCVGFDCANGEAFSFDTLRLKENNLRLHFDDTSTAASFPSTDWRLVANDTSNGGAAYLAIEDASMGRQVFRVAANARANALVVDAQGDVGIGTSTPATDIDIKVGDTPAVRLQQDGTSGFASQTWDMAGNETSFFIRDVTAGSTLPFRIMGGGAPSQSLVIDDTGYVGLGTTSPDAPLHILRSDSGGKLLVEDSGGDFNVQVELIKNGTPRIRFDNSATDVAPASGNDLPAEWDMGLNGDRDFIFRNVETNSNVFTLEKTGDLTIMGALTENSDKNAKMAIVPVDADDILTKVQALPIATWSYKDNAGVRHIGPMAQDFYALFGTGIGETGISTLDTSGVALAAIKALSEDNQVLSAENAAQRDLIAQLATRLDALEGQIAPRVLK